MQRSAAYAPAGLVCSTATGHRNFKFESWLRIGRRINWRQRKYVSLHFGSRVVIRPGLVESIPDIHYWRFAPVIQLKWCANWSIFRVQIQILAGYNWVQGLVEITDGSCQFTVLNVQS
jgi:hypothetical protein